MSVIGPTSVVCVSLVLSPISPNTLFDLIPSGPFSYWLYTNM